MFYYCAAPVWFFDIKSTKWYLANDLPRSIVDFFHAISNVDCLTRQKTATIPLHSCSGLVGTNEHVIQMLG